MSNDKTGATWNGGELPGRTPLDTFATHGAPPVPPVEHAEPGRPYLSPGPAPWGTLHQDIGHEPKRSGWKTWNPIARFLVIGGVVLVGLALCGFGALVLAGAGGKAVVDTVNDQATARAAEIRITSCTGPDEFDMVTVKYTIHNGSADAQSYLPQFDLGDGKGTVYGQAGDIVNNLAAGKDYKGSAANVVQAPKGVKIVCSVTGS